MSGEMEGNWVEKFFVELAFMMFVGEKEIKPNILDAFNDDIYL
jgi:hypothetical protein